MRPSLTAALAATIVLGGGCAVGPDFTRPPAPAVVQYGDTPAPGHLAPGAGEPDQQVLPEAMLSSEWWELFHSPTLSDSVKSALAGNQTLAAAQASLDQAEETVIQARAAFFPQIDFTGEASRQQSAGVTTSLGHRPRRLLNLFSLGPTLSFTPDLFGLTRRQVEQAEGLASNQACQLANTYLTLTGNVVAQAIGVAGTRLEIAAVQQIVDDDERNLGLVKDEFDAGKAARTDVLSAETQLANDRAQLPPLAQQLSVGRHALEVLLGRLPAEWSAPDFDLGEITLPGDLPLTVPSALVRQRPDILAAEGQLHAASAAIGVATAEMFPQVTLSASFTQEALSTDMLFPGSSSAWQLASSLTQPIFHGGQLASARRGSIDAFRGAAATYRQTVLTAFQQVADTLDALAHDADLVGDQREALDVAEQSLALQRISYREGKSTLLQLLDAQRLAQEARLGYARAQTQRYQDTAQLFVAMGGRWWEADVGADTTALCAPEST